MRIVGKVSQGRGYKSNGTLFISSSEVILRINAAVFSVRWIQAA